MRDSSLSPLPDRLRRMPMSRSEPGLDSMYTFCLPTPPMPLLAFDVTDVVSEGGEERETNTFFGHLFLYRNLLST